MGHKIYHRTVPNQEVTIQLLNDINHLTFIAADMDRLIAFYERVFEARVKVDLEEDGLRHTLIEVGPHTFLHPFEVPGVQPPCIDPIAQLCCGQGASRVAIPA